MSAQRGVPGHETPDVTSRAIRGSADRDVEPVEALPLSPDEGLSILGAALESRGRRPKADCSHLVHAIYERAGFPYTYARSTDLYHGLDEFRRVWRPQPGDVVAWSGHMGIVVSPVQHSFFSALRSGLGVDSYTDPYWKHRGRPRFYRYMKPAFAPPRAAGAAAPRLASATSGDITANDGDVTASDTPPSAASASVNAKSPAAPVEAGPGSPIAPRVLVANSRRPAPGEIAQAVTQASNDTGEALRGKNIFTLAESLIIFDRLQVERVRVQRDQGWADVRISRALSVAGGKVQVSKHEERQRWLLYRQDQNSWQVVLPREAIYLPRDTAVRVLAHQLAVLTDTPEAANGAPEGAQLARLLSALLAQQP